MNKNIEKNGIIKRDFFARNTLEVAKSILGCRLCRKINGKVLRGVIVEAEAYTEDEASCHAYRGVTPRSAMMYKKPGTAYVYFTYGTYHLVNIVTDRVGYGSGVLIRAVEPLDDLHNTDGPGKLCKEMDITLELNGVDVTLKKSPLWLEYGDAVLDNNIEQTTRIGITKAADLPWRFYVKNSTWVSKK